MEITVLGSGAAYPRPGGACSGYLIRGGGVTVWLDAGNGTFSNAQKHVSPGDVDALVLSHSHGDHIADTVPFMYALGFDGEAGARVPLYSPPDVPVRLRAGLGAISVEMFERVFDLRPTDQPFALGELRFEPFRTVHPVETYGYRISEGGPTFVYTADTAHFEKLPKHCRDAALLLCEATYVRAIEAEDGIHLWAHEAGQVAHAARAERLVLTHIWTTIDPAQSVQEAAAQYSGPIEAAAEGTIYSL